ncbi:host cell division inhibitor Icd-like protein [Serratia fonticola]|nr:host cell division inhibitor Icd-like protein [Serratia fonticola]
MNCAFVSSAFNDASMSFTTSWGKRALSCCDFLLVELDDISRPLLFGGIQYAIKMNTTKDLCCDSVLVNVNRGYERRVIHQFKHSKNSEAPKVVTTPSGPLTKPLYEVTIMADIKSTQTRPKYHFRFLAIDRANRAATPCRMSVEAYTEREARQVLAPHFILSLAARMPVQGGNHV